MTSPPRWGCRYLRGARQIRRQRQRRRGGLRFGSHLFVAREAVLRLFPEEIKQAYGVELDDGMMHKSFQNMLNELLVWLLGSP